MHTAAALPSETGSYTLQGIASGGDVEFSPSFTPGEDVYGNRYFLVTVPIEEDRESSLDRITLTGPEGEVTVDSGDREVRQHRSGERQVERTRGQAGGQFPAPLVQDQNQDLLREPQHASSSKVIDGPSVGFPFECSAMVRAAPGAYENASPNRG